MTPRIERYNYLRERKARVDGELARLEPEMKRYESERFDIEHEYFRRLQLDGVLPRLAEAHVWLRPANTNHKNDGDDDLPEETDEDGRNERDFEIGSKG